MPTYEYQCVEGEKGCQTCNVCFEVRHGMNEPGPARCARCGGKVSRVISAPGLSLRYNEKAALGDDNLKRHGFKKLVNEGGGKFGIAT